MANGNNGRISLETVLKVSQIAVLPLLAAMLWLLLQVNSLDRRLAVIEARTVNSPSMYSLIEKLAVVSDRCIKTDIEMEKIAVKQDDVRERLRALEEEFGSHRRRK